MGTLVAGYISNMSTEHFLGEDVNNKSRLIFKSVRIAGNQQSFHWVQLH